MSFDLISWCATATFARARSKWSQEPSDVLLRIQRRYRKRFKQRHGWREYVAAIVGVSTHTVGAWKVGTMRPTKERAALLRAICRDLGRSLRASNNLAGGEGETPCEAKKETAVSGAPPALRARSMASFAGEQAERRSGHPNPSPGTFAGISL